MENLVKEILQEPEFKQGGFVYKHVAGNNPDPIRAVQSTVDRMRDLYDIEDSQFGQLCERLLKEVRKICKS
jgi:hypothetical protein